MVQPDKQQSEIFDLEVDGFAKSTLLDMANWTKYLGILGFILLALFLVFGVLVGVFLPQIMENIGGAPPPASVPVKIIVFVIVWVAVSCYPSFALIKYAVTIKAAILSQNRAAFNQSISYLKNMFRYTAVLLSLYILFFIVNFAFSAGRF